MSYVSIRQHPSAYVSIHQHTQQRLTADKRSHVGLKRLQLLGCRSVTPPLTPLLLGRRRTRAVCTAVNQCQAHHPPLAANACHIYNLPRRPLVVAHRQWHRRAWHIRQHTSAYVSMRQHTSAYVSIRQQSLIARGTGRLALCLSVCRSVSDICSTCGLKAAVASTQFASGSSIRQHTSSAYASIREHTRTSVSIRQHTSAYVSMRAWLQHIVARQR
jgi:hypothetical protein